jgi:hypothetical protein
MDEDIFLIKAALFLKTSYVSKMMK